MIHIKHQVNFETEGEALYIRLSGEIDHHSAVGVRVGIDEKMLSDRPKIVYLDLSSIDFMDSSGLGLIMGRLATANRYGGQLIVLDPSVAAQRMIRLAALDRVIQIQFSKNRKEINS
ncbi:MAG: STAS domain-containing protein [Ruminococcaceae bacterium]|nr:STAS domain-containing protein [Oscillospiraceae bacterium]